MQWYWQGLFDQVQTAVIELGFISSWPLPYCGPLSPNAVSLCSPWCSLLSSWPPLHTNRNFRNCWKPSHSDCILYRSVLPLYAGRRKNGGPPFLSSTPLCSIYCRPFSDLTAFLPWSSHKPLSFKLQFYFPCSSHYCPPKAAVASIYPLKCGKNNNTENLMFAYSFFCPLNFNPVSKAHITALHKMFVPQILRFVLNVHFHVMSGIFCTNLFACGRSLTHGNWQQLFIQLIHYRPHFVKLVITRALIIGLFVLLRCRQIWIFSNIF